MQVSKTSKNKFKKKSVCFFYKVTSMISINFIIYMFIDRC